ncbi:unnamed protein product [Lymnaea stagnalis]|uniref:Neutral metalloproteinase n=1 Tax=Lymnaea stagnalis TaxID=6523 RepID=A0AAV2HIY9_LYMST
MGTSNNGEICHFENEFVKGVDQKRSMSLTKTDIASFKCSKGYKDDVNGGSSPMYDAFFFATKTTLMYREMFNHIPMGDHVPYVKCHYGFDYNNAFWDGTNLYFGDGDGWFNHPLTGCDMVAHEFSHGVTERASNLAYWGESGAINEAFSDMAGEAAELYTFGKNDWLVAGEMFIDNLYLPETKKEGLRYFDNPTRDGLSINHVKDFKVNMNVHYGSGVYNQVFYNLSQAIGVSAAMECFVNANRLYWKETTTFENGACGTLKGAYEAGYDMEVVAECFRFVGITLFECKDISQLVTSELPENVTQTRMRVSPLRNPLFKINVPHGVSHLTITVSSPDVTIFVGPSHSRAALPLAAGAGNVSAEIWQFATVYSRFSADVEIQNVSATLLFY